MIALDTNVLVRLIVADDPAQHGAAVALVADLTPDRPGFVAREVVLEFVWVLERTYRFGRTDIADAVDGLLASREIVVETAGDVATAIAAWRDGEPGFGDRLIAAAARRAGASELVTFDRKAATLPGSRLLEPA